MKEGQPLKMPSRKRGIPCSFYMDQEQLDALEEIHWRERKSVSEIVRLAIADYIRAHANGNSSFKLDIWQKDPSFKAIPTLTSKVEIWSAYMRDCKVGERADLLKHFNKIRNIAIKSGPVK